ncbi:uncharacterized protein LOC135958483 [Calliphora vicina]|uniref:uncharacterized protein LOC135958483 n=1 Tax=Calliphora vicina TaxID=7373 RepID=UPI00325BC7D1
MDIFSIASNVSYYQILNFLRPQECLRLKIIERLLKEGSSAEEPINIPLSDYSSDEGSSSSSDNEGKASAKEFSDLEGPCCHPLRAPPCSPELDVEIRKFRYSRMRKIMQELDRIYFQPLFHKKFRFLLKAKRSTIKKRKRKLNKIAMDLSSTTMESQTLREKQNSSIINQITLQYVRNFGKCESSTSIQTLRPQEQDIGNKSKHFNKKRLKAVGPDLEKKRLVKVSRKLRLWLKKRKIFIVRRKLPHRLKFRLKSLHRRKKDERLLLDMPTTDPGSDLLFSTDDEYIDANGVVTCYGTMPPRIRRNLLKSELQRRYIEEIGDGLRNMPPELIITSPSNKPKQKNHSVRILYKPTAAEKYERKLQTTNELPFIGHPAKRTSSWHNLNTAGHSPTLTPYKPSATKNKAHSPFYRPLSKKEPLTKEDLDIKLSLKKKIWTGIQPDDISLGIDRTRPLSWVAPQSLKSKKMSSDQHLNCGLNLAKLSSSNNTKRWENEAFLTACTQKLMEWQIMNSNPDASPCSQKTKVPLKLVVPDINEDRTMCLFKHLANIKKPCTPNSSTKPDNEATSTKIKTKRTTISKVVETSKILTKISKSKPRNNLAITHRAGAKQTGTQHRTHGRSNKFKTGGLVVTAVQTGVSSNGAAGAKKNKKLKSLQNKLANTSNSNANNVGCVEARRPSTHNNNSSNGGLIMAATATTIVRKVKTKLKKKKLSTNVKPETAISLNAIYNNNSDGSTKSQ